MDSRHIDPSLATDLSKLSDEKLAADLSKDAIEARKIKKRLVRAAARARKMNSVFKGITGAPNRRGHIMNALERENLTMEDVEKVA